MREAQVAEMLPDKKKKEEVLHLILVRSFNEAVSMAAKVATEAFEYGHQFLIFPILFLRIIHPTSGFFGSAVYL